MSPVLLPSLSDDSAPFVTALDVIPLDALTQIETAEAALSICAPNLTSLRAPLEALSAFPPLPVLTELTVKAPYHHTTGDLSLSQHWMDLRALAPSLEALNIASGMPLTSLPMEIGSCKAVHTLWAWGLGLTSISRFALPAGGALTYLYLDRNKLVTLPDSITQLPALRGLNVGCNSLTSLPENIGALTALQSIGLEHNKLKALPESFCNLISLRVVHLERNKLRALPASLSSLVSLERLFVSGNDLTSLPPRIYSLPNLRTLSVASNLVRAPSLSSRGSFGDPSLSPTATPPLSSYANTRPLGDDSGAEARSPVNSSPSLLTNSKYLSFDDQALSASLTASPSLLGLDLGRIGLTTLPPPIATMSTLEDLSVMGNFLTTLPPLGAMRNLRFLAAYRNVIESIDPAIWAPVADADGSGEPVGLNRLISLSLRENRLTDLDFSQAHLPVLNLLVLTGNKLTGAPKGIERLTNLSYLHLVSNQLTEFPTAIAALPFLKTLGLDNNQLTSIDASVIRKLPLEHLSASNNAITSIPAELGHVSTLAHLKLSGNRIASLPANLFGHNGALKTLDLESNQLVTLPASLCRSVNLEDLNLRFNMLNSLPPTIELLTNLKSLDISGNNIPSCPVGLIVNLASSGATVKASMNPLVSTDVPWPAAGVRFRTVSPSSLKACAAKALVLNFGADSGQLIYMLRGRIASDSLPPDLLSYLEDDLKICHACKGPIYDAQYYGKGTVLNSAMKPYKVTWVACTKECSSVLPYLGSRTNWARGEEERASTSESDDDSSDDDSGNNNDNSNSGDPASRSKRPLLAHPVNPVLDLFTKQPVLNLKYPKGVGPGLMWDGAVYVESTAQEGAGSWDPSVTLEALPSPTEPSSGPVYDYGGLGTTQFPFTQLSSDDLGFAYNDAKPYMYQSVSIHPNMRNFSFEELRWEDMQRKARADKDQQQLTTTMDNLALDKGSGDDGSDGGPVGGGGGGGDDNG